MAAVRQTVQMQFEQRIVNPERAAVHLFQDLPLGARESAVYTGKLFQVQLQGRLQKRQGEASCRRRR